MRALRKQWERERIGGFAAVFAAGYLLSSVYFLIS